MEAPDKLVLIVDDHRSFAEAIAMAIDAQDGLRCVAIAGTAARGVEDAARTRPDLALVDMQLPDSSGPELIGQLRALHPHLRVLALTAFSDASSVSAAARAGVCAFLRKECSVRDIVGTLLDAGNGPMVIDVDTLAAMTVQHPRPASKPPVELADGARLTGRELEVLELLAEAFDAQGIAKHLGISIHTSRGYVKSLLAKFEAHTQLELVVRARRWGVISDRPTSIGWTDHAPMRGSRAVLATR